MVAAVYSVPAAHGVLAEGVYSVQTALLDGAHALQIWSAISMLASACCVLQFILSALAFGCSGINAVLGPLRPPVLVAAAILQLSSWAVVATQRREQAAKVAVATALTVALSLSPEFLELWRGVRPRRGAADSWSTTTLRLAKVSCSTCASKVIALAEAVPGVERCDVDLDSAEATLCLSPSGDGAAAEARAVRALARGGYPLAGAEANANAAGGRRLRARPTCRLPKQLALLAAAAGAAAAGAAAGTETSGGIVPAAATGVAPWPPATSDVPQVQDLHREYHNIFRFGNRNAASHLWASFLLERAAQMPWERLELFFSARAYMYTMRPTLHL